MHAIQREIMEEKADALARTERRLLAALDAYRAPGGGHEPRAAARREDVTWELVDAVTCFVVQREACGLRDAKYFFDFYRVPAEVVRRIGVRRQRRSS